MSFAISINQFMRKKRRGAAFLLEAIIAMTVMAMTAAGVFYTNTSMYSGFDGYKTAVAAQMQAESKASEIKVMSYADTAAAASARAAIPNTPFEREVIVGAETNLGTDNKKRDITVNVYKPGEAQPRASLPLTVTLKGDVSGVPVGTVIWCATPNPPQGFLVCNGSILSATAYPALVSALGSTYGAYGKLPDLRGEFIRGADLGRGVDSGRLFGSSQGDAIRNITGQLGADDRMNALSGAFYYIGWANTGSTGTDGGFIMGFDASRVVPTADENRPRNVSLLPCIKY